MKTEQSQKPTEEALSQGAYREEDLLPVAGSPKRHRRLDGTELDRLLLSDAITPEEHQVLALFQADLYKAGLVFSTKSSMEPSSTVGGGDRISDSAFMRAKRVNEQMTKLKEEIGQANLSALVSMLQIDTRLSQKFSGVLKKAAAALSLIYS